MDPIIYCQSADPSKPCEAFPECACGEDLRAIKARQAPPAASETDPDALSELDGVMREHGPTLYVPPDGGTAYDVVDAEARHDFYDRSGVPWTRSVDGVTGEPPEPADYRDL